VFADELSGTNAERSELAACLLKGQGTSLGMIAAKTGIPKTSLHATSPADNRRRLPREQLRLIPVFQFSCALASKHNRGSTPGPGRPSVCIC
jgi:hypothetical protein